MELLKTIKMINSDLEGGREMSDTPETDAAWAAESGNGLNEVKEISRKLERERDEAREALMKIEEIFIDGGDTYLDFVRI